MTIETIKARIQGKEKALDKLRKKMDRILAAQASGWTKNPYYYRESDIKSTQREIDAAQTALAKYKADLQKELYKTNNRNIKPILNFLEKWKANSIAWYKDERKKYLVALEEFKKKDKEYNDKKWDAWHRSTTHSLNSEEYSTLEKEHKKYRKQFSQKWGHVTQFNHSKIPWEENLEIILENEKNRKYDDIVKRTTEIVGQITDASALRVNNKGNLDGFITGIKGTVKVETIGAGGYNIQAFHFRTLIHEI